MSFVARLVGFVVSHAITLLIPLVRKRYEMSVECQNLADGIKKETSKCHMRMKSLRLLIIF